MWEFELILVYLLLSIWRGNECRYIATNFILYTIRGFVFLLIGVLGLDSYGSNEPTLNFETLANQSSIVALKIIFYIGFLIVFAVKLPIIPLHAYMVLRYSQGGPLQYLYASSQNFIKNRSNNYESM
ncbi:hypothetical protein ES288_D08G033600v1 [Gossypium darwinii]|uniref:NADH:quinone oxidoreductase/Mrp antiporter transmembrane domain-containing protein n=1 Tax=Gossypium darwinii TaxID=34276 RepID=A0A5D2BK68_GOSDA|nr:hypothetical protein ES288_D08G033600v1 [Gossypium darwinii]